LADPIATGDGDGKRLGEFELRVRAPEGLLFTGPVVALRVPSVDGHLGVLANHAPMLAALRCGIMQVLHPTGEREVMAVGDGFAEVTRKGVSLVVHFLDFPRGIDRQRAHLAMGRALARLRRETEEEGLDLVRAEAALCRSIARLSVCGCGCVMCHEAKAVPRRG